MSSKQPPEPHRYRAVKDRPPNFLTGSEDERCWMYEWVSSRLHDEAEIYEWRGTHLEGLFDEEQEETYDGVRAYFDDDAALRAAERGDVEPLRMRHPKIARFINLPPLERGKKWRAVKKRRWPYPPRDRTDRVDLAAAEVAIVRAIWKKHYGRTNQPRGGQLTPADIVALRWDVAPEEVLERLKRAK